MIKLAKILYIDDAKVTLKIEQNKNCSDCKSHCNDGFLSFLFHNNTNKVDVARKNKTSNCHLQDDNGFFNQGYKTDDVIGIDFGETNLLRLTAILYGLPILLLTLFLVTFYLLFNYLDLNPDLGGIAGLVFGLFLAKQLIVKTHKKIHPQVKFFK